MKEKDREKSIEKSLILNLRDLGHVVRNLYEGKGSQKRVLILLKETGEMTQAQLTQRLGIRQGSASEVIRKLDYAGLICRTTNAIDKRTVDIYLTEAGETAAALALSQRKERHKEMFSCLTKEEKEELLRLTEKLKEDWEEKYCARREAEEK